MLRRPPLLSILAGALAVALLAAPGAGALDRGAPLAADPVPTSVTMDRGAIEADFVARINQLRGSRGLAPLAGHGELTAQARSWASTMAGAGRIFHASDLSSGITANWVKLGENVGVGGDVASLFQAFVDSPSHLANLVDPAYGHVGVGVVLSGGRIYTAHRFMALGPPPAPSTTAPPQPPPPPPPPPPPTSAPTTAPTTTAAPSTTAPTTAPTTTTTTTTTTAPDLRRPVDKLGPVARIADLIADPSDGGSTRR